VLQHLQATAAPDQTRPILDSAAEKGSVIIGIASIIDGDTIEIHGHRIRLFGVDAPESRQLCSLHGRKYRCGQKAAFALSDFLGQHTVSCKQKDTDRYGRAVAICSVDRQDVGAWMVSRGFALAFRRYSLIYVPAEESAAAAKAVGRCSGLSMGSWRKNRSYRRHELRPLDHSYPGTRWLAVSGFATGPAVRDPNAGPANGHAVFNMRPNGPLQGRVTIAVVTRVHHRHTG
jgi:endonuclease YncB( thermonuclease family)